MKMFLSFAVSVLFFSSFNVCICAGQSSDVDYWDLNLGLDEKDNSFNQSNDGGYFGLDLGFGFDANDNYSKMPFVMDAMVGTELLLGEKFFFGCFMGYNFLSANDSGEGYKSRYNEHIIKWFVPLGFAYGKSMDNFNFRIGPTIGILAGMKSVTEIGKEKYVTRLRDMDPEPSLLSIGLRMGVTLGGFLEVTYEIGLLNHIDEDNIKHQVTFGFPIKFLRWDVDGNRYK